MRGDPPVNGRSTGETLIRGSASFRVLNPQIGLDLLERTEDVRIAMSPFVD